jgi:ketosteroid isomerase-like protein
MDEQSIEFLRRGFAAFNRNDPEAVLEFCHPEIEWRPMRQSRAGAVYRGHAGVKQALIDVAEEFEELRNDPRDFVPIGGAIVVTGRLVAKERTSGVRIDRPAAWVCELREGRLGLIHAFPDGESAEAAARERAPAGT